MLRNKEIMAFAAGGLAVSASFLEPQVNNYSNLVNNAQIASAGNMTLEATYLQTQGAKFIDVRTNKPFDTVSEALQPCGEFSFSSSKPNMPEGPAGESIVKRHTLLPGEVTVIDGGGVNKEFQVNNYTLFKPQDPGHYINIMLADNGWKADGSPVNAEVDVRAPGQQTVEIKGQLTDPAGKVDQGTLDQMLLNRLEEVVKYHANANQLTVGIYFAKGGANGTPLWMEFDFRDLQNDIAKLKAKIAQNCANPSPTPTISPSPTVSPTVSPTPENTPTTPITNTAEVLGLSLLQDPEKNTCLNPNIKLLPVFNTPDAPAGTMQKVDFVVPKGKAIIFSTGGAKYIGREFSASVDEKQYHVLVGLNGNTGYSVEVPKGGYAVLEVDMAEAKKLHETTLKLAQEDSDPSRGISKLAIVMYNGWTGEAKGKRYKLIEYLSNAGIACVTPQNRTLFMPAVNNRFEAVPVIVAVEQPKVNLPDFKPLDGSTGPFDPDFSKVGPEVPNGPDLKEETFVVGKNAFAMWDGGRFQVEVMENGQLKTYEAGYDNANPAKRGRVIVIMEGGSDGASYKVKLNRGVLAGGSMGPNSATYGFAKRINEIDQFRDWQPNDEATLVRGRKVNGVIVYEDLTTNWKQFRDRYFR